jgi:hypothetical protein
MSESISAIAKVLLPVAKALSPKVLRVYRERQAGRMPVGGADDLLKKGMEETLNRLIGNKIDDTWWREILGIIGHKFISPEFLRIHAVREWLSVPQVQTDFKSLAREHIMGKDDYEQGTLKRLRQTYADNTGEDERLADGPVEVIVAIIVAGYFGSISPEIKPVVGMIQDHARESNKTFQKFGESLGSIDNRLKDLGSDPYAVIILHKKSYINFLNGDHWNLIVPSRKLLPLRSGSLRAILLMLTILSNRKYFIGWPDYTHQKLKRFH